MHLLSNCQNVPDAKAKAKLLTKHIIMKITLMLLLLKGLPFNTGVRNMVKQNRLIYSVNAVGSAHTQPSVRESTAFLGKAGK